MAHQAVPSYALHIMVGHLLRTRAPSHACLPPWAMPPTPGCSPTPRPPPSQRASVNLEADPLVRTVFAATCDLTSLKCANDAQRRAGVAPLILAKDGLVAPDTIGAVTSHAIRGTHLLKLEATGGFSTVFQSVTLAQFRLAFGVSSWWWRRWVRGALLRAVRGCVCAWAMHQHSSACRSLQALLDLMVVWPSVPSFVSTFLVCRCCPWPRATHARQSRSSNGPAAR